ncbi:C-C motif chemokine 20 [Amphiprion ocellaris]|uniref:Chemokine interleukin-8-like domain-containing protein n=1 Tax=Amphiprion ocellaris TaxID=80972 RepID=A0A3Q1AKH7_AMPOC|nr:C-C motif chemokine 20 [Amphiprion ocellaris]
MRFNMLFFMLVLSYLCFALAQVSYDDCCLKYVKKMGHSTQKHAVRYRVQKIDGGCNIPAIIFTMRRGRMFCTDPREKWVQDLMKRIDKREPRNDNGKLPRKYHPRHSNRG